jgi:hypothetical protein
MLTQPPKQQSTSFFSGEKRLGPDVEHLSTSSTEVKERVELFLYSHFVP